MEQQANDLSAAWHLYGLIVLKDFAVTLKKEVRDKVIERFGSLAKLITSPVHRMAFLQRAIADIATHTNVTYLLQIMR